MLAGVPRLRPVHRMCSALRRSFNRHCNTAETILEVCGTFNWENIYDAALTNLLLVGVFLLVREILLFKLHLDLTILTVSYQKRMSGFRSYTLTAYFLSSTV